MTQLLSVISSGGLLLTALALLIVALIIGISEVSREQWPLCGLVCGLNALLCLAWSLWIQGVTGDAIRIDFIVMGLPFLGLTAGTLVGLMIRLAQYALSWRASRCDASPADSIAEQESL